VSAPRVAPGSFRQLGPARWGFGRIVARATGRKSANLFTTLGRHRRLFWGWLWFAGRLMPGGKLPRRETELVILRVAHLRTCDYEWDHHVRLGRRAGINAADLERVKEGAAADGWSAREEAILTAADELHAFGDLSDETWDGVRSHLGERETIEFCMLVGHYEMLATTIATLRIQRDAPAR
jgi:AhpD family alkylhydroperoxidase